MASKAKKSAAKRKITPAAKPRARTRVAQAAKSKAKTRSAAANAAKTQAAKGAERVRKTPPGDSSRTHGNILPREQVPPAASVTTSALLPITNGGGQVGPGTDDAA